MEDFVAPEAIEPLLCQPTRMYDFIRMSELCNSCFVNFAGIFAHTFRLQSIFVEGKYLTDLFKTKAIAIHVFCTTPKLSDSRPLRHAMQRGKSVGESMRRALFV